jgi:TetR/AcrR family transcriptional regulator, tetracycline repressor protein
LARPKVPLISRRNVLEVALKIIDDEGLDSLSIRRLADELNINGASLYHHFANKEAIVVGAAELALEEVRTPERDGQSWREWLPTNARQLREALVEHPHIVPVVASWRHSGMGSKNLDASAALLIEEGVPSAAVLPLLDALELFAIGSALAEIHRESGDDVPDETKAAYPALAQVLSDRGLGSDEIFDLVCISILDGIERAVQERRARWLPAPDRVPTGR